MRLRTEKRDAGQTGEPAQIQGVWVRTGDSDEDSTMVSQAPFC